MNYLKETKEVLGVTMSQLAELFGIDYSELVNIMEGNITPSDRLIASCKIAREIFLNKSVTKCDNNKCH